MSSIGIMDEGYFVSRREIFKWIRSALNVDVNSLQQLGKGDIYCSLLNHFHPGCVQMSKVNKSPRTHQIPLNLKHLQNAIDKLGIQKKIDIAKIAKCKPLDNLQFSQWLKRILQKDAEKIAINQTMTASICRSSVGGTITQRIQRKSIGGISQRISSNSNHTIKKYRENIPVSCYQMDRMDKMDRMDTNVTMDKLKWIEVSNKKQTPVKKSVAPLKDKPVLVPAMKMKCIEALLSDQSTTDDQKLGYLRNLLLRKEDKVCELIIQ